MRLEQQQEHKLNAWHVLYVACLLALVGVSGGAWREWRALNRGVERRPIANSLSVQGTNVSLETYPASQLPAVLQDVVSLGFTTVRQRFPWREIEPQPGEFVWQTWDTIVRETEAHGLRLIAVLDDPPEWSLRHDPYPLPCLPPCQVDAYARFVGAFASRYGTAIDDYQVWDEPNLSRNWGGGHAAPCGYAVLLEAAYTAIHKADTTAFVLGGGLAPTQAAGPADLNDLVYLRELYAAGGGAFFDVLAVKAYGFWSGPEDRRVDPDALNFSRIVALREIARARGDRDKPVWAVEWGWHVISAEKPQDPPPWGTDWPEIQQARIVDAVRRAHAEWPWLQGMCWAMYQPDGPSEDPHWGFALRDPGGAPTALYGTLGLVAGGSLAEMPVASAEQGRLWLLAGLSVLGWVDAALLWVRPRYGRAIRLLWRRWRLLSWPWHLALLVVLAALYAVTPRIEWMLVALCLSGAVLYTHPMWALLGAVGAMPFIYATKPVLGLHMPPGETLLYLAVAVSLVRQIGDRGFLSLTQGSTDRRGLWKWRALDLIWLAWVVWGVWSAAGAPDAARAWHEWRLCLLDPALLYLILRVHPDLPRPWLAVSWLVPAVGIALLGIGQAASGMIVEAGAVGRVTGIYYSPNHLALYLERLFPLALSLCLCAGLSGRRRILTWTATGVLGVTLYLTYSRGAWLLGLPVAFLAIAWCYRKRLRGWMVAVVLVVGVLAASNVLAGRAGTGGILEEIRVPVWQSTLRMIADHPWRGVGLDGFQVVYLRYMRVEAWTEPLLHHPHNAWLDAAVRTGLPGLALYGALVGGTVWQLGRALPETNGVHRAVILGCLAGLLAGAMHGLVDSGYFLADLAWSLALVGGIVSDRVVVDRAD